MATEAMVLKPQNTALARTDETASTVLAAQAKALVEARYIVAMQRPRDLDEVREALLKECRRPRFAEVARYSKPKGKKKNPETGAWEDNFIKGPSIRFAEAALRCMKNVTVESCTIYDDREKRIMRVTVCDIESNVPYSLDITIQKAVERSKTQDGDVVLKQRLNSYGKPVYLLEATDDEILDKQNALISKAVRTLGLRLVPGDLIDEGMEEVVKTQLKQDAQDPDAAKKRLLDAFIAINVTVAQIKQYLGHGVESIEAKELQDLREMYAALKEGETTWREIMDSKQPAAKEEKTEEKAATRTGEVLGKINKKKSDPSPAATSEANPTQLTGEELFGQNENMDAE
jgi:hypothetical protein